MRSLFFQIFWEIAQRVSRDLDGLDLLPQSLPTSCPHSCACVILCFARLQELQQGCLSWKSAPHPLHDPCLQPHLVLSHRVLNVNCYSNPCLLVQTILGCLHGYPAMVFGDIHIIPLSCGILHPAQPPVLLWPCDVGPVQACLSLILTCAVSTPYLYPYSSSIVT